MMNKGIEKSSLRCLKCFDSDHRMRKSQILYGLCCHSLPGRDVLNLMRNIEIDKLLAGLNS